MQVNSNWTLRLTGLIALVALAGGLWVPAYAQDAAAEDGEVFSDEVTINVQGGSLVQVLNAFSRQTGKSIVIGPEVEATVNVRLSAIPWQDALDVILKPYGYGYQLVGEAIVINNLESFATVEQQEALVSRVFELKYLDAAGVKDVLDTQLSSRGKWSALTIRGQRGWVYEEQGGGSGTPGGDTSMSRRRRMEESEAQIESQKLRSKTIIVIDTPNVVESIAAVLEQVDRMPIQVLIEARFVEVSDGFLQDVGVEFGTGPDATSVAGVQAVGIENGNALMGIGVRQTGGGVEPAAFAPETTDLAGTRPYQAGMSLLFQHLTDLQFEVLLHMMEEEAGANLLSSPRVMTLNDQEATIMVGTKYPIIQYEASSGNSGSSSTSLEYYENIGIQLNVVPQICDDNFIRMIVNPRVRTLISTTSGVTGQEGSVALTQYPVMSTREAETQILVKSGETVVIGGLLEDQETKTELRVPILGSLPLIGRLFRRETVNKQKMDLLIFLTATAMEGSVEVAEAAEDSGAAGETVADSGVADDAGAMAEAATERLAGEEAEARDEALKRERIEAAARRAREERLAAERAQIEAERREAGDADAEPADAARQAPPEEGDREAVMERFPTIPSE